MVARSCRDLRRLDLEECVKVTDVTLQSLALSCHRLSHVNIAFCDLVSDEGVRYLGHSACAAESLQVLELDNLSQLTDACLVHLYSCHNLRRLELIDCQYITPVGINRLVVGGGWGDGWVGGGWGIRYGWVGGLKMSGLRIGGDSVWKSLVGWVFGCGFC